MRIQIKANENGFVLVKALGLEIYLGFQAGKMRVSPVAACKPALSAKDQFETKSRVGQSG